MERAAFKTRQGCDCWKEDEQETPALMQAQVGVGNILTHYLHTFRDIGHYDYNIIYVRSRP